MSINFAALNAYAGKYAAKIIAQILMTLTVAQDVTVMDGLKNTVRLPKLSTADFLKPYDGVFAATADALVFGERQLTVSVGQGDLLIEPEQFRYTFLGDQLANGGRNIPEEQFIFDRIKERVANSINTNIPWIGDKAVTVTNAASKVRKIADGFAKIIAAEITATKITPVVTGAITSTNAMTAVETVWKSLNPGVRGQTGIIYVSYDVFWKYCDAYDTAYKTSPIFTGYSNEVRLRHAQNWTVRPCLWMGSSQRILATLKENLYMGTDALSELSAIKLIEDHYTVEMSMKVVLGFQIADLEVLAVNDQA